MNLFYRFLKRIQKTKEEKSMESEKDNMNSDKEKPIEPVTWLQDRNRLRALLRDKAYRSPIQATFFCVLVAAMRGKVHMWSFKKYAAGWRRGFEVKPRKAPEGDRKLQAAYGSEASRYYARAAIENLEDQEEWIRMYAMEYILPSEELQEIASRVLSKKWAEPLKDKLWEELEEEHDQSLP